MLPSVFLASFLSLGRKQGCQAVCCYLRGMLRCFLSALEKIFSRVPLYPSDIFTLKKLTQFPQNDKGSTQSKQIPRGLINQVNSGPLSFPLSAGELPECWASHISKIRGQARICSALSCLLELVFFIRVHRKVHSIPHSACVHWCLDTWSSICVPFGSIGSYLGFKESPLSQGFWVSVNEPH